MVNRSWKIISEESMLMITGVAKESALPLGR